jgi:integrase
MAISEITKSNGTKTYLVYVNGIDRRGKRIQMKRRGITTRREAEKIEADLKRQISNLKDGPANYTWDEWFQICMERMRVEMMKSTLLNYESKNRIWLEPKLKGRSLKSITPGDVHEIIYDSAATVSWYTRKATLKIIKRILQMAVENGVLAVNPALRVKVRVPQVKQAVLSASEIDILLREAKAVRHRFYEVWALALLTGMRSGELFALTWQNVDFDGGKILVAQSWSSKNGIGPTKTAKHRIVPMSQELRKFLRELSLSRRPGDDHVLPRLSEWESGYQAQVIKDFCQGIGITPIKFHDLRATFITQLLGKGVPLAAVMAIVGHASLRTTQGYLRMAGIELAGATEKLGLTLPGDHEPSVIKIDDYRKGGIEA